MSRVPYPLTAIRSDDDSSGKNIVPYASVSVVDENGNPAQIYLQETGGSPSSYFELNENGFRQIWAEPGRYTITTDGGETYDIFLNGDLSDRVQSVATIADFATLETAPGRLFALQSISGSLGDNGGIFESVAGSATSDGINRTPTATPGVYVQRLTNFAETVKSVPNITALKALTNIFDGQVFLVREYNPGSGLGGGNFVFDAGGSGGDDGYVIPRTAGGVFRRITGSRTIEDYGYSSGDLTIGQIRTAVASGNIDRLDINFEPTAFVSDFLAANIADTSGLRINGANIRKSLPNQKIYAAVPKEFPFQIPFKAWIDGGKVGHDYDITQHDAIKNGTAAVTYYIDPVNGLISNDGLTELTPMKDLYGVFLAEQSSGLSPRSVGVLAKGGFYPRTRGWMDALVKPSYDLTIKSWDGVLVEMWEATSPVFTPIGDNCYTATRTGTFLVVDRAKKNEYGDYTAYRKMNTQEECRSVSGSFHFDSSTNTLTVHCIDDRVPDNYIMACLSSGHLIDLDGEFSFDIYLENVAFYGGGSAAPFTNRNVNNNINVYLNKCLARYSASNGFTLRGIKYAILNECEASYTGADGFNYHSSYSDSRAERCDAIEINCLAKYCGSPAFSDSSNRNASTAHDSCNIARFGTVGYKTYGPVIIDVNDVKSYNFYCRSGMSIGTSDNSDYVFSSVSSQFDGTTGWLDNCQTMGGSFYGLMSGSGALVHIRDCYLHPNIYASSAIREYTGGDVF